MVEPVVIGVGENKWVKDANTKMLTLNASIGTSNAQSAKDGATPYQVPVGKKFICLSFATSAFSSGTAGQEAGFYIYDDTVQDAGTGTLFFQTHAGAYSNNQTFEIYYEIPAGHYVTLLNGSFAVSKLVVVGVETDV